MSRLLIIALLTFPAALLTFQSLAFADSMAGLQLKFASGTDASIQRDASVAVSDAVKGHPRFSFQAFSSVRSKLHPVVKDCFTTDCLQKAGATTGADFGLRVRFSGEAQIYDWSIDTFNLKSGKVAKSRNGSCELCGRDEVVRTLKASVTDVLNGTKSSSSKSTKVVPAPTPNPRPRPQPTPEPTPTPNVEPNRVQLTEVHVTVEPTDAIIMLDGQVVGKGETTVTLSKGTYELRFKREGYQGFIETLVIGDSSQTRSQIRVHMSKTDPDAVVVSSGQGIVDRMDNRNAWGILSLVSGGIFLVTGIILTNLDGEPNCDGELQDCPDVYATGLSGIILTTTGAVLATAGAGLLLWDILAGKPEEPQVRMAPTVGPGQGGFSISGAF